MKIGIYSGSFNPVHVGHVALADYLTRQQVVEEVWLVRSPLNPLKASTADLLASNDDREAMLRLAIAGHQGLQVSTIEDQLPRPNYTIQTFTALSTQYPEHDFSLIIGADNWLIFDRWREARTLALRYHLIVYPRPGYPLTPADRLRMGNEVAQHVTFVDAPQYDISSTALREALAHAPDSPLPSQYLHPDVLAYIRAHHLYA